MFAVSVPPIAAASFCVYHSKKFRKPNRFCTKRLDFWGESNPKTTVSLAGCPDNRSMMPGLNGIHASRNKGDVHAFEQEAFMEESSNLVAGGLEYTLNKSSKWLVAGLFAGMIIWRHDLEILWAVSGAILNVILSTTLKKILNHERPVSTLRSDPGMPSSHAQSIFYVVAFLCLSVLESYGVNGLTTALCGLFLFLGSYFSWLRVSQRLHTVPQVLVGAVLGSSVSILWIWLWKAFVLSLYASSLWFRIVVILGAIGFCLGFLHHAYRHWIVEADDSIL